MSRGEPGVREELLDAALSIAIVDGWHVFPCLPGRKQPALKVSWQAIATTDPARIRAWWRRTACNIGIACGPSRLVVLDLDVPGHGAAGPPADGPASGAARLAELCRQHGQPHPHGTLAVRTPSGGRHLFFQAPRDVRITNSAGRLAPLIDIRSDGGYVVGYASRTPQGRYEVIRPLPPAPLPAWLSELARQPDPGPVPAAGPPHPIGNEPAYGEAAIGYEAETVARAAEGTRNDTLFKAARSLGQLVAGGMLHADDVRAALTAAAATAGLKPAEISRTIDSGLKSGALRPRRRPDPAPRRDPGPSTRDMAGGGAR